MGDDAVKKVDGRPDATGTPIEKLMDEVCKYGMCPEVLYPTWEDYNANDNIFLPTTSAMYSEAKQYKPKKRVDLNPKDIETLKYNIVNNGGCVAIVRLYNEHLSPIQGCVIKPDKGTQPKGLHAIWVCGYVEDMPKCINGIFYRNWFIMQESYGLTRGYKGYLFVPYEAFIESWTGLYTMDSYIKSLHTFEIEMNKKYSHFHDGNKVDFPYVTIEFKIGSTEVKVNETVKYIGYPAIVEKGTTLVPFRFLCEALGYAVSYSSINKVITAYSKMHNQVITMQVGSHSIKSTQGGKKTEVNTPLSVMVINGYTLIPLRGFAELTGALVQYYEKDQTIIIRG